MNRMSIAIGAAAVCVFAAVYFLAREPVEPAVAATPAPTATLPSNEPPPADPVTTDIAARAVVRPASPDPRLAALMVSPDNGLVELVPGPDGRVIKEIDKDPNSPGFSKPLREYTYAGDRIVGVSSYRYLGQQTEIVTARVSYKPDGTVDRVEQSSHFEPAR